MSRIGRLPVAIPAGVEVSVAAGNVVTVKGPKGTLERALPTEMEIKVEDGHVVVTRPNDLKKMKALHGLTRSLIHNMVVGVSEGYTKELEVNGVGYRAQKQGKKLVLSLGYSHPVEMEDPESFGDEEHLKRLQNELIGKDWFQTLPDFNAYVVRKQQAMADYAADQENWSRRTLINIAEAGFFSSDRTIAEYDNDIWHLGK